MKIKISQIDAGRFAIREELDKEYFKEIKDSLRADGQWNPILVRPKEDGKKYEVVAGHCRLEAAKKLGWKEIKAEVRDLSDEEADFLSLKTNLMRSNLSEMEEGRVIKRIVEEYNLTQEEMGKKLNKSQRWVSSRLSLVLKVVEEVQNALAAGKVSADHVTLISTINSKRFDDWEDKQREFLDLILKNEWTRDETRTQLKRFFNTTLFTIGYQGREIDDFVKVLKENEIEVLLDARYSAESQYKPEFSGKLLARELKKSNIEYEHHPDLGIPYVVQNPYKDGDLSFKCLEQWYRWHIKKEVDLDKIIDHVKDAGKTAIMCMERYAEARKDQKYHCHRHILANMFNETLLFPKRIDL